MTGSMLFVALPLWSRLWSYGCGSAFIQTILVTLREQEKMLPKVRSIRIPIYKPRLWYVLLFVDRIATGYSVCSVRTPRAPGTC
ncbi:hypothetical protein ASPBRDRAFT_44386 [Aspergillus brasiliensis CBS 101740]|uniref:Uncharacterized protein n=1 Tax=Aspergillus brasiliensis (strain CBS 101740 / IMI 381727 / IBT 21946) TaxID=767769 RepID=A0A1L9UIL0_ASPBC|nr:hypothetical protein ASPBRDRAFT_44386 [Aspergillus brasiliensis CBS 101740]